MLATSRAFRSLRLPAKIQQHLSLKKRRRGFGEAQMMESLVLLQTIAGIARRYRDAQRGYLS